MITEFTIEEVIIDQHKYFTNKTDGVIRNVDFDWIKQTNQILVVTGVRRCGKSVLLRQISNFYPQYHYINFDDERLFEFSLDDFQTLMLIFQKQHQSKVIFLDEIQNVPKWELFIRRIYNEGYKIFITGSNAKLLSSDLATHLTGIYVKIELYPFSFAEYLTMKQVDYQQLDTTNKAIILKCFDEYLIHGGFPDNILAPDKEYLQSIFESILYRDLVVRFKIRNIKAFKILAHYLFTNFTGEISYNAIKKILNLNNVNTVSDYMDYLQQAYLNFECYKFDFSLKNQLSYNKKTYAVDNGLRNSISFNFSKNNGKLLENFVYMALRNKYKNVWFVKTPENYEVDFLIQSAEGTMLFQVCYNLETEQTYEREIRALLHSNKWVNATKYYILTYNTSQIIKRDSITIEILPAWKYFLNQTN